jgi:hypothetical protein
MDEDEKAYQNEDQQLFREWSEWLPKQGDKLIQESPAAAYLDPLGHSGTSASEARSQYGRWSLYSDGFLRAGNRLVEGSTHSAIEDALIYPIVYLYRHHLELELKGLIAYYVTRLPCSKEEKQSKTKKLTHGHSLKRFWNSVRELYPICAQEMLEATNAFQHLLFELDSYDPSSQAARYPMDNLDKPTLSNLHLVDLDHLKSAVNKMSHYLSCIHESMAERL